MELTKLVIKGFKSFGDKITINFNEGVTAIVGPNGCGKSNVVDAIRWVLGEQSTKNLRSEKMENIIFNGSKDRKPANLAEVSLTFHNNKNILPTEFTTVTITRKLYRNGDSEYRLNDVKCRLKDITDLFLDTGVGTDTYSIIELKMIDEIIANKDNSRRTLFEEASGISKYKVRKKQTLSRLKDTESDLERVDDLLFEIHKNLKTVENQAKKAKRFETLKEEYKQASTELAYHRLIHFSDELDALEAKSEDESNKLQDFTTNIDAEEKILQNQRNAVLLLEQNVFKQQKVTNEYRHKIQKQESKKQLKEEQIRHLTDKETRLKNDLAQDKLQREHISHQLKRHYESALEEQAQVDRMESTLQRTQLEVDALRGQQQTAKHKLDSLAQLKVEQEQQVNELEKALAILRIKQENFVREHERNELDASIKRTEKERLEQQLEESENKLELLNQELEQLQLWEKDLNTRIQSSQQLVQDLESKINQESRLLDAKQNEYNLTKSLVDNLEGFPESIRFLRKNACWKKPFPLLSDVLFCQEDYRVAIESFLEPIMNYYVVDTQTEAVEAIRLLSDASRGKASFFVLDAIPSLENAAQNQSVENDLLISAMSVIRVEEKYKRLCEQLLQQVFLLRSTAEEHLDAPLPQNGEIILHPEGKFAKNKWGLQGGSVGLFEGKRIGRAKNLENLAKEIKALNKTIAAREEALQSERTRIVDFKSDSQQNAIQEIQLQANRWQNESNTTKAKLEQYESSIQESQERNIQIESELRQIKDTIARQEPLLTDLSANVGKQQQEYLTQQEHFSELNDELNDQQAAYNQENIKFHQQKNKLSNIQKDIEYFEQQGEQLDTRIAKNTKEHAAAKDEIKEALNLEEGEPAEDLKELLEQKEALEIGLESMETEFHQSRTQIVERESAIAQLRKKKELTEVIITEYKDKKTRLQIDLHTLKERLSVEFSVDIQDLLSDEAIAPTRELPELEMVTAKLKKQIEDFGVINSMAKEAYEEMSERHAFIVKEKNDLLEAKNSLLSTIHEIDQTAKDKFMLAFNAVRENFVTVFRSLFNEEDSCDLVLSNPQHPLESDIDIIAQPKGKRPLSINQLSGGEKTLTSTALLFSLYLLKPAPFCIFDEVDAPLDDTNIDKFNNIIREFSKESQFIVVSHNKRTIANTDIIYGVTMVEQGVSRVVAVDLRDVAQAS
ncbi:chromosome segregation protein SMC [Sphingobacterium corticis]|uniref:Chromosome partition protein Smc n=1 Tax=Sphingobacterium corticis TaxID=1812823 RepID=A0ABW5NJ25_9SPHI